MINIRKKSYLLIIIILTVLSLAGFSLILFITSKTGPGISPDSVSYIAGARNLLNGNGLTILLNSDGTIPLNLWQPTNLNESIHIFKWPPLYPLVLALPGIFNLDIIEGARWINSTLFGLNIFLLGFILIKTTKYLFLPLLASLIFLFSKEIIAIHHMVWSEPLFILLVLLALLMIFNFFSTKKILFIFLSALCSGLAFLTRYSGAALILTIAIALLFLSKEKIRKRFLWLLLFAFLSCLPASIWFLRLQFLKSGISVRRMGFNTIPADELKLMIDNITKWFLPGSISFILRVVFTGVAGVLILAGFIIIFVRRKDNIVFYNQKIIINILLIFIILYTGFNFLTRFVAGANMDFYDNRHLTLILSALIIIITLIFDGLLNLAEVNKITKIITGTAVYSIFIIFIVFYIFYFFCGNNIYAYSTISTGTGYYRKDWRTSETIAGIKELPESILIYTNEPCAIYILTNRPSKMIPSAIDIQTKKPNVNYLSELKKMEDEVNTKKGIIIIFKTGLSFFIKEKDLKNDIILQPVMSFKDGTFYEIQ